MIYLITDTNLRKEKQTCILESLHQKTIDLIRKKKNPTKKKQFIEKAIWIEEELLCSRIRTWRLLS